MNKIARFILPITSKSNCLGYFKGKLTPNQRSRVTTYRYIVVGCHIRV